MVKYVQGTSDVDFQRRRYILRFLFFLCAEGVIQVLQNRHVFSFRFIEIIPVYLVYAAVNDGFLHRGKPLFAANDQFAKGENEVRFQRKRAFLV